LALTPQRRHDNAHMSANSNVGK